jgi:hypothetical protein
VRVRAGACGCVRVYLCVCARVSCLRQARFTPVQRRRVGGIEDPPGRGCRRDLLLCDGALLPRASVPCRISQEQKVSIMLLRFAQRNEGQGRGAACCWYPHHWLPVVLSPNSVHSSMLGCAGRFKQSLTRFLAASRPSSRPAGMSLWQIQRGMASAHSAEDTARHARYMASAHSACTKQGPVPFPARLWLRTNTR